MSSQVIIYNDKSMQYLYCTQGYRNVVSADLFGTEKEIANNLYNKRACDRKSYCIWAAGVIQKFIGDASQDQIWLDVDTWFSSKHTEYKVPGSMYMMTQDLDEWCQAHEIVPDEWIK